MLLVDKLIEESLEDEKVRRDVRNVEPSKIQDLVFVLSWFAGRQGGRGHATHGP